MLYNIDFEVVALGILLLVLGNIPMHNMVRTFSNRIFRAFLICGIFNVVFDIASTVTMSYPELYPRIAVLATLQAYFLFQLCMPMLLSLYVFFMHATPGPKNTGPLILRVGAFVFMAGVVLSNPLTGALYYFDAYGTYSYGPWQYSTYIYAFLSVLVILADLTRHRKQIARRDFYAVWQYAVINTAMLILQMFFGRMLFIGVGICASLVVLIITTNNPLAKIDPLTGLFDSTALREVVREWYSNGRPVYPVLVALDNLKRINMVFGYEAGNRVLRICAARLADEAGRDNTFRLMSDTFVITLPTAAAQAEAVREITVLFSAPWALDDTSVHLSAAVCSIPEPGHCKDAGALLDYLDYMLFCAKAQGAGTILADNAELAAQYTRRKEIESYLYTAVENNLFEVYLQPIYSFEKERFVSAEALVRLNHPELGALPPAEFIPIAERSGEIAQVERCIFKKLCEFLAVHPEVHDVLDTVKFNLSPASFLSEAPSCFLLSEIDRCRLDATFFQFEITETVATVYDDALHNWAQALKDAGAGICLDDFGSGYANLDAVMKLPFDVIKMNRSLLLEADAGGRGKTLYEKLTDTLRGLGYCVLAEGAETAEEVAFLRAAGVQLVQGFYYAKPQSPEEFLRTIAQISAENVAIQDRQEGTE